MTFQLIFKGAGTLQVLKKYVSSGRKSRSAHANGRVTCMRPRPKGLQDGKGTVTS